MSTPHLKIFTGSPPSVERDFASWASETRIDSIVAVTQSEPGTDPGAAQLTLSVIYLEKTVGHATMQRVGI
jgi:hypothetical protein